MIFVVTLPSLEAIPTERVSEIEEVYNVVTLPSLEAIPTSWTRNFNSGSGES